MAMVSKGDTFTAERNYDSTLVYSERVIELAPHLNRGYGLAGSTYFWLGKIDQAREYYLKAIELPPQDGRWLGYHRGLGRVIP